MLYVFESGAIERGFFNVSISSFRFCRFRCALAVAAYLLLPSHSDAQVCPSNVLYVSSDFGHEVLRFNATTGQYIDTFVSFAAGTGLNEPHGILDRGSDVLVASFGTDAVLRYDRDTGALLGTFADSGSGLNEPVYILNGPDGNLYIASQGSDEVLRYDSTGQFIDAFVSAGAGGLDGPSGMAFGIKQYVVSIRPWYQ